MLFWIVIFSIMVFLYFISSITKNEKIKKICALLALTILCIISGTRYNLGGSDYFIYENVYDGLKIDSFIGNLSENINLFGFEKGFILYATLIKYLGFSFYGFTLINSIIFYFVFYNIMKKYNYNFNFIIIMFMYKMFFYNTFISMRQPIAILIFYYSLTSLKEKKYIKYFLCCFLAFFFHRAAIILFFIPLITNMKVKKNTFLFFISACLLIYLIGLGKLVNLERILSMIFVNDANALGRISLYTSSGASLSILYILESYLLAIFIYMRYDYIYNLDDSSAFFIKLFMCAIPFYTIFSHYEIVTRFKDFFFISYPVLIYLIMKSQKKIAPLINIFVIFISFYGYVRFINNFDGGHFLNYRSFLFENISIFR